MDKLYNEVTLLISEKEKESNELSKKNNKTLKDMVDEVYLKGELSSLNEVLNIINKL